MCSVVVGVGVGLSWGRRIDRVGCVVGLGFLEWMGDGAI